MIAAPRKKKISDIAHYVASQFYQSNATDMEAIAKKINLDKLEGKRIFDIANKAELERPASKN